MSDNIIEGDFSNTVKCKFCKRAATRLCDITTGMWRFAGHPPKVNGIYNENVPVEGKITCDNPICERCSIKLNEHMDICPDCYRQIQLKKKMKCCSK